MNAFWILLVIAVSAVALYVIFRPRKNAKLVSLYGKPARGESRAVPRNYQDRDIDAVSDALILSTVMTEPGQYEVEPETPVEDPIYVDPIPEPLREPEVPQPTREPEVPQTPAPAPQPYQPPEPETTRYEPSYEPDTSRNDYSSSYSDSSSSSSDSGSSYGD